MTLLSCYKTLYSTMTEICILRCFVWLRLRSWCFLFLFTLQLKQKNTQTKKHVLLVLNVLSIKAAWYTVWYKRKEGFSISLLFDLEYFFIWPQYWDGPSQTPLSRDVNAISSCIWSIAGAHIFHLGSSGECIWLCSTYLLLCKWRNIEILFPEDKS